jgi:hypothetical protein
MRNLSRHAKLFIWHVVQSEYNKIFDPLLYSMPRKVSQIFISCPMCDHCYVNKDRFKTFLDSIRIILCTMGVAIFLLPFIYVERVQKLL